MSLGKFLLLWERIDSFQASKIWFVWHSRCLNWTKYPLDDFLLSNVFSTVCSNVKIFQNCCSDHEWLKIGSGSNCHFNLSVMSYLKITVILWALQHKRENRSKCPSTDEEINFQNSLSSQWNTTQKEKGINYWYMKQHK